MLLFKNAESRKHFFINLETSVVVAIPLPVERFLKKHASAFDLHILVLPNYKTVTQFRKIIATGEYANTSTSELYSALMLTRPELFI